MKFELIGSGASARPVAASLAKVLRELDDEIAITFTSIDRSQAAVDFARSHGAVLSSQAELYQGYVEHKPGFNPANPPGYSTHERRSDGVAYPQFTRGLPIPAWATGIDSTNPQGLIAAAGKHGYVATVTYPGSSAEAHHINFRRKPIFSLPVLKFGSKGPRVRKLTGRLSRLRRPHTDGTYLNSPTSDFNANVKDAVRAFQADHHLVVDGIVGTNTLRQLKVSIRAQRRHGQPQSGGTPVPQPEHHDPKPEHGQGQPFRMFDSITLDAIPKDAGAVAGYVNGAWPTFAEVQKRWPKAKHLSIAVTSSANAECLDVEPGDATPADAAAWVKRQIARGVKKPVVYTSVSQAQTLLAALAKGGIKRSDVRLWTAHYSGKPHLCDSSCGFGFLSKADATQFTDHSGGRNLDESYCAAGFLG